MTGKIVQVEKGVTCWNRSWYHHLDLLNSSLSYESQIQKTVFFYSLKRLLTYKYAYLDVCKVHFLTCLFPICQYHLIHNNYNNEGMLIESDILKIATVIQLKK